MATLPKSLFNTKEFKTLKKACGRLEEKNTLKNITIFEIFRQKTILLAMDHYNDVGYNKKTGNYLWIEKMMSTRRARPEWTQTKFSDLWRKHWPVGGTLDMTALLQATQEL